MKYLSKIIFATILSLMFFSCNKEENLTTDRISSIEITGQLAFNKKTKKAYIVDNLSKLKSNDVTSHSIKHVFTFNEKSQTFSSGEELRLYLSENQSKVNGKYEIFIDNIKEYSVQIVNGKKVNQKILINKFNKSLKVNECSFKNVKACAIKKIHDQNWFDMTKCILAGFGCVAEKYATCTVDLCLS